jgi:hypothetical protein
MNSDEIVEIIENLEHSRDKIESLVLPTEFENYCDDLVGCIDMWRKVLKYQRNKEKQNGNNICKS